MNSQWTRTDAAQGDGLWFEFRDGSAIEVIAPPGVWLSARHGLSGGWSAARWEDTAHRSIDSDPPDHFRTISAVEVLECVGREHADTVEAVMIEQLLAATNYGQPLAGRPPVESRARLSAEMSKSVVAELAEAFPGSTWQIPGGSLGTSVVPDTVDELLLAMGGVEPRAVQAAPRASQVRTARLLTATMHARRSPLGFLEHTMRAAYVWWRYFKELVAWWVGSLWEAEVIANRETAIAMGSFRGTPSAREVILTSDEPAALGSGEPSANRFGEPVTDDGRHLHRAPQAA